MGTDKSRLRIENETFIDRIAATLADITDSIKLVGTRYAHPSFQTVPDVYPGWGALGGLHAALAACERDWAIVVACDLPFVTPELFEHLAALRADHDSVVPLQPDGRPQPLAALYRAVLCRERAAELIQTGHRRPLDLLQLVNTRWVPFIELTNLPQAEKFFVNINTPEDYDEATTRETLH